MNEHSIKTTQAAEVVVSETSEIPKATSIRDKMEIPTIKVDDEVKDDGIETGEVAAATEATQEEIAALVLEDYDEDDTIKKATKELKQAELQTDTHPAVPNSDHDTDGTRTDLYPAVASEATETGEHQTVKSEQSKEDGDDIEPYIPKNPEYWGYLSSKCRIFSVVNFPFKEINPPEEANKWSIWYATLIKEARGFWREEGEPIKEKMQIDTLMALGASLNNWHNTIKNVPELRNVRTGEDTKKVKGSVIQKALYYHDEVYNYLQQAKQSEIERDALFLTESFFYGSEQAHDFLSYYELLNKHKNL